MVVNVACHERLSCRQLEVARELAVTTACRDVLDGTYYPCASIYTLPEQTEGATVSFNFGVLTIGAL